MTAYKRRTRSEWESLVADQINSPLSAPAFCTEWDISYASFITWKKRLTADNDPRETRTQSSSTEFVEITSDATGPVADESIVSSNARVELDLGGSLQLRIYAG